MARLFPVPDVARAAVDLEYYDRQVDRLEGDDLEQFETAVLALCGIKPVPRAPKPKARPSTRLGRAA